MIDAMKMALTALENGGLLRVKQAIAALRQAIEEAEKQICCCGEPDALGVIHRKDSPCYVAQPEQEPVAYFCSRTNAVSTNSHHQTDKNWTPLYALEALE
jgi:hypothetical protein